MKYLITGSTSFAGSHLADYLVQMGGEVHGLCRARSPEIFRNPKVTYHVGDITDYNVLYQLMMDIHPDRIFHLAAQSFVPLSWKAPTMTMNTNAIGSLNILEAVRHACPIAKVLVAGTSEEYGYVAPEECPIDEDQPLRPLSPYGASKVSMDMLARVYARSYCIDVVIGRAFNHTGPRRGEEFVTSKIAKRLAEIHLGMVDISAGIELGNIEAVRDFSDVRDIVRAYALILESGDAGEAYNIGSGRGRSIREVIDTLYNISGVAAPVKQNKAFLRPSDVPLLVCNANKLKSRTAWEPKYSFDQTMLDLFHYWLERLS